MADRLLTCHQMGRRHIGEHRQLAVEQREIDELAPARPVAVAQRRQNCHGGVHAGVEIGDANAELGRGAVLRPGDAHDPAQALHQEVITRARGFRARLAEPRDRAHHQPRKAGKQVGRGEAMAGEVADLVVLDQHIGVDHEPIENGAVVGVCEIQRHRALVAVGRQEIGALRSRLAVGLGLPGRPPAAGVIAVARPFDLDHIGAEIAEHLRAARPRQNAGQVEHAHTGQCAGRGLGAFNPHRLTMAVRPMVAQPGLSLRPFANW